jgi:hypothetical protein
MSSDLTYQIIFESEYAPWRIMPVLARRIGQIDE